MNDSNNIVDSADNIILNNIDCESDLEPSDNCYDDENEDEEDPEAL
jgi:hypothetical protein